MAEARAHKSFLLKNIPAAFSDYGLKGQIQSSAVLSAERGRCSFGFLTESDVDLLTSTTPQVPINNEDSLGNGAIPMELRRRLWLLHFQTMRKNSRWANNSRGLQEITLPMGKVCHDEDTCDVNMAFRTVPGRANLQPINDTANASQQCIHGACHWPRRDPNLGHWRLRCWMSLK